MVFLGYDRFFVLALMLMAGVSRGALAWIGREVAEFSTSTASGTGAAASDNTDVSKCCFRNCLRIKWLQTSRSKTACYVVMCTTFRPDICKYNIEARFSQFFVWILYHESRA